MPVTRSQKDAPLRPASRPSDKDATEETAESEGVTSASGSSGTTATSGTNTSSGTATTEGTTTAETTVTAATTAASENGQKKGAAHKETTKKIPEDAPEQGVYGSATTLKPKGVGRRARSTKTTSSSARRRELEAREELARLELKQAQAAAKLARVRLELAQCEDEDSVEEDQAEQEDRTAQVQNWIQSSILEGGNIKEPEQRGPDTSEELRKVKPEDNSSTKGATIEIQALATALREAFTTRGGPAAQPKYIHELPYFDGSSSEWLAFKVVYEDTAPMFNDVQNMARLRRALKGNAREAIKSLLYSEASPLEVMQALKRRYGRPDALVLAELDKVKTLPKISENPRDICIFASQINNSVAAIKGLKKPQYLHSPEMVKQIIEKIPTVLKFRWYDFTAASEEGEFSDLTLISKFLNREADKCGAFATSEEKSGPKKIQRQATHSAKEKDVKEKDSRNSEKICPMCEGEHFLVECQKFQKASVQDRWATVKKSRVCFKCLQGRHRKESCRKPSCKECKRWHHHLLHVESEERTSEKKETPQEVASVTASVNAVNNARAYLKIVPVEVFGSKGSQKILALMDEGSTVSLLDKKIAEEVGAQGNKEELVIETVGGKLIRKKDSQVLDLTVKGVHQENKKTLKRVRTVDELKLTPQFLDKKRIQECQHLKNIADSLHYEGESPQLLIGQDNWELIVTQEIRRGKPGEPVASRTGLGWVLHGSDIGSVRPVHFLHTCLHVSKPEEEMHQAIKDHFAIEALGVMPRRPTTDSEGRALTILEKTCRRLENGRFEAGLLWKKEEEQMPESYTSAKNRLINIEKKMDKDSQLKAEYCKQIQHLIDSKYAEEAPDEQEDSKKIWYLPHFSVVHPLKKKIRIVFDAAAKSKGRSLNDALLPGPDLLQSLFGILLRFRQGPLAVAADIKEMFLQVRIRPEDRDSLRFLWRGDHRDVSPKKYRMTSVIFGATSSPSTAIYVKNRNAADYKEQYPDAVRAIELNHYMDDYLHSFHSEDDFRRVTKQVDFIHKKAGFELRGWASNQPELLQEVKTETTEKTEVDLGEKEEKTLGLRWFTERDSIGFRANLRNTPEEITKGFQVPTKREVTSAVMSTFDPLGLASPVLIQGKKLLQSVWRSGIGWDEQIEEKEYEAWKTYLEKMKLLQDLQIPRCLAPHRTEGELHTFTDASETAYAATVYWRTEEQDGTYQVSLVAAKVRVTPLKPVSIPRLELQAALLGSRLAHSVEEEMDLKAVKKTYWTDSSIVLSWIKTDPRTFKTFVAHRLAEIEDLTKPQDWRWVPTAQNPADDATRDVPDHFDCNHRWYTGPDFLRKEEIHWPAARTFKKETTGEEKTVDVAATARISHPSPDPEKFSSWKRLLRATARVLQFVQLCRSKEKVNVSKEDPTWKVTKGKKQKTVEKRQQSSEVIERSYKPLDTSLLEQAETLLLKRSQENSFREDIRRLQQGKQVEGSSKLKKLDVVLEEGLLRLQGRIDAIQGVSRDYKRPVVLDSKEKTTQLIIEEFHCRFNHGNHATVMNEIRQRFWVLGLRSAIKTVRHQCQWCKVRKAKPQEVTTGNLPTERLMHCNPPFTCTGIDYFGPITITVARRHEKRWGALFTCLTTRAVHIELTPSLSTDSMIMALRRFAARRGMPKTIYTDNGTNFVGANKELKEALDNIKQDALTSEAEKIGVQWKFIPPGAPNMGGAWERLVRSIKTALDATLNEKHPREEVLHTLLLEAEHIVNSRPLTHLSGSLEEEALTPNHFLLGRSCGAASIGSFDDSELVGRHTWKATQRLADHFWQRWLREYLPTLLPRKTTGRASAADLHIGDIVLIVDHSLPRCTWPRGRIQQVYPGPDGRVRVVDVETKGGVLRRPSSRVVLLVPGVSPSPESCATHEGENVGDGTLSTYQGTSSGATQVSKVYILLRPKKGKPIEQRLTEMLQDPVYDMLKEKQPNFGEKIVPVAGDAADLRLGLSEKDWTTITEEVNIIFHMAATTRFDESLRVATMINVRGAREALVLGKACEQLKSYVHVSTAYSHACENLINTEVLEDFYRTPVDPETLIRLVETVDEQRLNDITPSLIKNWPNTYSFGKAVAEETVRSMCDDLPLCVVRPAIVICAQKEPNPGWVDMSNVYGASGIVLGIGLGLMHTMFQNDDIGIGLVPVDYVNNAIIAAAWETAKRTAAGGGKPRIYTVTTTRNPVQWRDLVLTSEVFVRKNYPTPAAVGYCFAWRTKNATLFWIYSWLLHLIPAYIVDGICLILGKERRFVKLYRKMYNMSTALSYFTINEWHFVDNNTANLFNNLSTIDKEIFDFDVCKIDWQEYMILWCLGLRKYIVKDGLKGSVYAKKKQFVFKILMFILMPLYFYFWYKVLSFVIVSVFLFFRMF